MSGAVADWRVPPDDPDAAQNLLGRPPHAGRLRESSACQRPDLRVVAIVDPDDLYRERYATVFRAIAAVHGRGQPPDVIATVAELERHIASDADRSDLRTTVLGLGKLAPPTSNIVEWARRVHELGDQRRVHRVAHCPSTPPTTGASAIPTKASCVSSSKRTARQAATPYRLARMSDFLEATLPPAEPHLGDDKKCDHLAARSLLITYGQTAPARAPSRLTRSPTSPPATTGSGSPCPRPSSAA